MLIESSQPRPMKKFLFLFTLVIPFCTIAQTKPGYSIDFKINGLKDTTAYLGYYFADQAYIRDTANVNSKGEFSFNGKRALPEGPYFLVLNKSRLIDIMVGPNQHFGIELDTAALRKPVGNIRFKNDIDNTLYYENLAHNAERSK